MKLTGVLIGMLCIGAVLTGVPGCGEAEEGLAGYATKNAPDFEIKDLTGKTIRLSGYAGKVIIINFFATWCPPCRTEMPDFEAIHKQYGRDVKIIGINVGREGEEKVRQFVAANNLTFTIAMDDGRISSLYGPITAIPVTVIIGRDFNIEKRYVGMRPKAVFLQDIKELL